MGLFVASKEQSTAWPEFQFQKTKKTKNNQPWRNITLNTVNSDWKLNVLLEIITALKWPVLSMHRQQMIEKM